MHDTSPSDNEQRSEDMESKAGVECVEKVGSDGGSKEPATVGEGDDDSFVFTWGKMLAILSFQLGYFSDTLIISLISAAITHINRELGPSKSYAWMATAPLVAGAAFSPVVGRLGDIFGRRNFLLLGNSLAIVGCAISATAKDINTIIAGDVIIGVASAMRQVAWACLGEIVPKKSRGLAFGLFQTSLSPASAFAPLIAFGVIQHGSWRPIFWISMALDITALILVFLFYHPINQYIHEEGKSLWYQLIHIDWIGALLFMGGITVFLIGISFGGIQYPWASAGTIVPIIIGFVTLCALGIYETYGNIRYPVFPRSVFRNARGFTIIQFGVLLVGMLFYSTAILWPLQVQTLYATNDINIGLYSSASGLGGMALGWLFGIASKKLPHIRWQLVIVMAALTLLSGCQAIVTPTSNVGSTCLVILVFGFVAGASVLSTAMIQLGVPHEFIGIASGILVCARTLGGAIGATIYETILQNKLTTNIPRLIAVPLAKAGVPLAEIPGVIEALTSGDTTSPALASLKPSVLYAAVQGLRLSYASAFRLVYLISIAFGIAATLVLCFTRDVDRLMTNKIEIKLDEGAHIKAHTDTSEGHIIRAEDMPK